MTHAPADSANAGFIPRPPARNTGAVAYLSRAADAPPERAASRSRPLLYVSAPRKLPCSRSDDLSIGLPTSSVRSGRYSHVLLAKVSVDPICQLQGLFWREMTVGCPQPPIIGYRYATVARIAPFVFSPKEIKRRVFSCLYSLGISARFTHSPSSHFPFLRSLSPTDTGTSIFPSASTRGANLIAASAASSRTLPSNIALTIGCALLFLATSRRRSVETSFIPRPPRLRSWCSRAAGTT